MGYGTRFLEGRSPGLHACGKLGVLDGNTVLRSCDAFGA